MLSGQQSRTHSHSSTPAGAFEGDKAPHDGDSPPPHQALSSSGCIWGLTKQLPTAPRRQHNTLSTGASRALHHNILGTLSRNHKPFSHYYSFTIIPPPFAPWNPLQSNSQMETRACYSSGSRIHRLECGHTVAMPRDAEGCATNCAGHATTKLASADAVPIPYAHALGKTRKNVQQGHQTYGEMLIANGHPHAENMYNIHFMALMGVWEKQNADFVHKPGRLGGDFTCNLCGLLGQGHRPTVPAFELPQQPYKCIVVGKSPRDIAVIRDLEKGIKPKAPFRQPTSIKGLGAPHSKVLHGRINKHRMEEKKTVINQLAHDNMLEEWESAFILDE